MLISTWAKHNKRSKLPYRAIIIISLHHFIPTEQYLLYGTQEQTLESASEPEPSEYEKDSFDHDVTLASTSEQTLDVDLAHQLAHAHLSLGNGKGMDNLSRSQVRV